MEVISGLHVTRKSFIARRHLDVVKVGPGDPILGSEGVWRPDSHAAPWGALSEGPSFPELGLMCEPGRLGPILPAALNAQGKGWGRTGGRTHGGAWGEEGREAKQEDKVKCF